MSMNSVDQNGEVIVGVCTLEIKQDFLLAFANMCTHGAFKAHVFSGMSLLPQARNIIVNTAYEKHPNFTHLLFIDDDMSNFTVEHVVRLFKHNLPIVSGLTVGRRKPHRLIAQFPGDLAVEFINERKIVRVPFTGMAFTLIKREVLDAVKEQSNSADPIWFTMDRESRPSFGVEVQEFVDKQACDILISKITVEEALYKAIKLGQESHIGSTLMGEDVGFCYRAAKKGYDTWVDCGCLIGHIGEQTFDIMDGFKNNETINETCKRTGLIVSEFVPV